MNNIEYKDLRSLLRFYKKSELAKAALIDLFIFAMIGGSFIIVFANIIPMLLRYLLPGIIILYFLLVTTSYLAKFFFVETLKNYKDVSYINYKQISLLLTMVYAIIILVATIVIFTYIA